MKKNTVNKKMIINLIKINNKFPKLIVDWWTNEQTIEIPAVSHVPCAQSCLLSSFSLLVAVPLRYSNIYIYIIIHALGSQHDIAINWVIELLTSLPAAIAYHHNKYTTAQDARPQPRHFQRNRYSPCPSTSASSLACSKCRHFAIDYMAFHRQRYFFR